MKVTVPNLIRAAGLSAVVTGALFAAILPIRPPDVLASVNTSSFVLITSLMTGMSIFALFGITGLYARQVEKAGWLGLAGFVLFSVWLGLVMPFSFVEAFILPPLSTEAPAFVEAFLGMFSGTASEIDLGILPTLWKISEPMYLLGPLLFGIATFRAGILPRWAGAVLVAGATLAPVGALLVAPEYQPWVMVPNGLALVWLGYALFAERREKSLESLLDQRISNAEPSKAG